MSIMPINRKIQVSLLLLFLCTRLAAQYVPHEEWKRVETEHFILIFPEKITEKALELAPRVEAVYRLEQQDFSGGMESKWPLILTTSGMISNGYVSLAPAKSVWFGMPASEGLSCLEWYDLLNLHETRHMVQMDSLNRNFIRFLYILGGELGQAGGIYLSVPRWFLEGDAVHAETVYSESGRGRDPLFYSQMKVMTLEGGRSYQQYVNGSYREYYPNMYVYGYFLSSWIRQEYGDGSWDRILNSAASLPLPALGIYLGAKKVTGKSWGRLFQEMQESLILRWEEEAAGMDLSEDTPLLDILPDVYTRYEVLAEDGEGVVARKRSIVEPASLVRLQNGGEQRIARVPSGGDITAAGGKTVWTWTRPSLLYEDRSWSDLVLMEEGRKSYISKGERYYDPALSSGGDRLAVMEWSESLEGSLKILDPRTGETIDSWKISEPGFPSSPAWSVDENTVFFVLQNREGRSIYAMDLSDGEIRIVRGAGRENIKGLQVWGKYLIYAANPEGFENIIAFDPVSGQELRITSRAYAAEHPRVIGDTLYYSDTRNSHGSIPVSVGLDPSEWIPLDASKTVVPPFPSHGIWSVHDLPAVENSEEPEVESYSPAAGALNIHSWGIAPNLETMTGLRLQVQSTNIMNTLNMAAGGEYDFNERTWGAFLDLDWKKFYPWISIRNSADYRNIGGVEMMDLSNRIVLSFPLNLSRDLWQNSLVPSAGTGLRSFIPVKGETPEFYIPLNAQITASSLLPGSARAIVPRWGIYQRAGGSVYPAEPDELYRFYSHTKIYTPGFFRNTGITLGLALEEQSGRYSLSFPFARGYSSSVDYRTLMASADYDFPMAYPDYGAGSFLYIKRIRGNLFYDYLIQGDLPRDGEQYQSAGAALILDMTAANMEYAEFNLAFRFCWLVEKKRLAFQLVFMNAPLW